MALFARSDKTRWRREHGTGAGVSDEGITAAELTLRR